MRTFWLPWFLSLLLCLGATPLVGQATTQQDGPYFLSAKRDILYGGAAGGTVAFGHLLRGRTPDIVLADLRLGNIPPFDRIATKFSSEALHRKPTANRRLTLVPVASGVYLTYGF